jgi:glyoxylase-like metal-dependent hydrolase (beta-lactamase superfamily II)
MSAATEIAPGLMWLNARGSNFYLVADGEQCVLIDAGMPGVAPLVFTALAEWGRRPRDLTHILLTHADIDHVGSAAAIATQSGARVAASPETAVHLQAGTMPKHMPGPIQFVMERVMRYDKIAASQIDIYPAGTELPFLGGLAVIAAPGHTADQHVFFSRSRGILFAGDAMETRNGVAPSQKRVAADYTAVRRTARRLLALQPTIIACGHGPPAVNVSDEERNVLLNQLKDL